MNIPSPENCPCRHVGGQISGSSVQDGGCQLESSGFASPHREPLFRTLPSLPTQRRPQTPFLVGAQTSQLLHSPPASLPLSGMPVQSGGSLGLTSGDVTVLCALPHPLSGSVGQDFGLGPEVGVAAGQGRWISSTIKPFFALWSW